MKKTVQTLLLVALLGSPLISKAAVSEGKPFEGNDSNTSIQSEYHEPSLSEKIDNPRANGEYYVANGAIKVTTDSENKLASVEVVDSDRAILTHVHVKAGNGFRCYESLDGFGATNMYGNTNKHGKIQEISHITIFYHEVHIPEHEAPKCDHDTEIKHELDVVPGTSTEIEDGKISVEFTEDGYVIIKVLDKCINVEFVHGNEHYDAGGNGWIKVPVDKVDEIEIFISIDETCKPDVLPDVTPQEPVVPEPEEPKVPEFLPETGFEALTYTMFGLGLAGLGLVGINKKRK